MRAFPEVGRWLGVTGISLLASTLVPPAPSRHCYSEGPPPAHTGGFGEPTCHRCHFDQPINDPQGSIELEGLPVRYDPGRTYPIAVIVSQPELRRGGFQLSARFSEGDSAGRQAGLLKALDQSAVVTEAGEPAVSFAHHTGSGSLARTDVTILWTLEWTAPASQLSVVFHLAGTAANDDASELGDHVLVDSLLVSAASRSSP